MTRGISLERSSSFTRPADTTAYAAGDLVANSTTAGSVAQLSWNFNTSAGIWLRELRLYKSDPDIINASFRLWLHGDSAVTFTNGDNGVLSIASSTLAITDVALPAELPSSDWKSLPGAGDVIVSTFDVGIVYLPNATYGFLEARAAYTPGSAEVFTVVLRGDPY